MQIDDFLTPDEHRLLIDYALLHESTFEPDEKSGYRNAAVSVTFPDSVLADIVASRLRLLLPQILPSLDIDRLSGPIGLRLTAHRDGDEYLRETAADAEAPPGEINCTYHFHREPRSFSGGEIRLRGESGDGLHRIEPRNNGLLVHPTDALHEVLPLCSPTGAFADSRFAIDARVR